MSILKWGVDHDLLGDRRFGQDSVAAAVAIAAVDFIEVLRRAKKKSVGVANELLVAVMVGMVGLEWGMLNRGVLARSVSSCRARL